MNYLEVSSNVAGWFGLAQQGMDIIESPQTTSLQSYVDWAQLVVSAASTTPWGAVAAAPVGALLESVAAANATDSDQAEADVIAAAGDVIAFAGGMALLAAAPEAAALATAAMLAGVGLSLASAALDADNLTKSLDAIANAVAGFLGTDVSLPIDGGAGIFGGSPFPSGGTICDAAYASAIAAAFGRSMTDPLVIDLSGDGVQLVPLDASNAYFDLHDTGFAVHTGWVGAETGILVEDNNGNGTIDNITELFGNSSTDGFTALETLDVNHDGVINAQDPGFANLEVWTDTNGNGATDPGELHTLVDLGITSINLTTQSINQASGGNLIAEVATYTRTDGTTGEIAEAYFDNSQLDSKFSGTYQLNPVTLTLPNLRGYGELPDLYIAMSLDPSLLQMVQTFSSSSLSGGADFESDVRAILYQWAGVSNVDPDSRGPYVNAQDLGVLEKFTGEDFESLFLSDGPNPSNSHQGDVLESAFQQLLLATEARLVAQGPLASLLPGVSFNYDTDALTGAADLSAFATALGNDSPADQGKLERYWENTAPLIDQLATELGIPQGQYEGALEVAFISANLPFSLSEARAHDVFLGGAGADKLIANNDAPHYFDGGGGNDYEESVGAGDTFFFNAGYGQLEINEFQYVSDAGTNVLKFGASIESSEVTVKATPDGMGLVLTDGATGDQITVDSMLLSNGGGVQQVQFADGMTWTRQQLIQMETTGAAGNDTLFGSPDAELFDGKGGSDYETGNSGNDTFIFNAGYGHLEIYETESSAGQLSTLKLGTGISESSVRVTGGNSGADLVLTDGISGDQITLDDALDDSFYGIQQVQFADGTVWTGQELVQMETTGTTGNDTLYGSLEADVFDGKGGHDYEAGAGGNDTFIFNAGYGHLEVYETDSGGGQLSTLKLGTGISGSSVRVTGGNSGANLVLTDGISGDQITLDDALGNSFYGIQQVQFADGTTWTAAQLVTMARTIAGTAGNDTLAGSNGPDILDGKGGNDFAYGQGGNDTFIFNAGYGQLEIDEQDVGSSPQNVLKLGTGINEASISVTSAPGFGLLLTDGITGDQITLDNVLIDNSYGVQQVQFADGTVWTEQQLLQMEMTGTAGDDTLFGTTGADVLDGKGGNDFAYGQGGNDTFIFNAGYGQLEIDEQDVASSPQNTLKLGASITTALLKVEATSDGSGLILTDGVSGDQITLDDALIGNPYGVQQVQFADGTMWTEQQLVAKETTGTTAGDTLFGTSGAELFDGKGGKDVEYGDGGSDTYLLKPGYGALTVYNGDSAINSALGELQIDNVTPQNVWLKRSGNNLQIDIMGSKTSATIENWYSNSYSKLAAIQVTDGTQAGTYTLDSKVAQLVQAMATFASAHTGFDPTASANSQITDSTLLAAVSSDWHH